MPWTFKMKNKVRFSEAEAVAARALWGANCGPMALCAALNLTPSEVRPHLGDFENIGYMNVIMMLSALDSLGVKYQGTYGSYDTPSDAKPWAQFLVNRNMKLVRIQWDGPWTGHGIPTRSRNKHTHWIAVWNREAFDVNAIREGGWMRVNEWVTNIVPKILHTSQPKTANGNWWPTHVIEVERAPLPPPLRQNTPDGI